MKYTVTGLSEKPFGEVNGKTAIVATLSQVIEDETAPLGRNAGKATYCKAIQGAWKLKQVVELDEDRIEDLDGFYEDDKGVMQKCKYRWLV